MKKMRIIGALGLLLWAIASCVYPYEAEVLDDSEQWLVVEGDIIANDITTVKLSKTNLLDLAYYPPVERALVYVEDERQGRYPAVETAPGQYEAQTQSLDLSLRYRLYIELAGQKKYASDYVTVSVSPPVDSIGYVVNPTQTAIDIHVSTHDPQGKSRYYKWDYIENWEIHSSMASPLMYDEARGIIVERPIEKNLYYCWTQQSSTGINLGSTVRLQEDIVDRNTVLTIWDHDHRTQALYAVKMSQKVLTVEAYTYWEQLRKNSEDIGGIFSPQPSDFRGNIYSLDNPDERVLGYISASTLSYSERLFIPGGILARPVITCDWRLSFPVGHEYAADEMAGLHKYGYNPVDYVFEDGIRFTRWWAAACTDCRVYGTKDKPSWWPNDLF